MRHGSTADGDVSVVTAEYSVQEKNAQTAARAEEHPGRMLFGSLEREATSARKVGRLLMEGFALGIADIAAFAFSFIAVTGAGGLAVLAVDPAAAAWFIEPAETRLIAFNAASLLVIFWFWSTGHYSKRRPFWDELHQVLRVLATGLLAEVILLLSLGGAAMPWSPVLASWLTLLVLVPVSRFAARRCLLLMGLWKRQAIIVGTGENAAAAYTALCGELSMGYDIRWFGRSRPGGGDAAKAMHMNALAIPIVELSREPDSALAALGSPAVIVALNSLAEQEMFLLQLGGTSDDVFVIPSIRGLPLQEVEISPFFSRETLLLQIKNNRAQPGAHLAKRTFDVVASLCLLLLLTPLALTLACLIRRDGGKALFSHTRVGRAGRPFRCLKFRSMVVDADQMLGDLLKHNAIAREQWKKQFKLKNDPRITRIGAFLRKTSLDELPQLINVLKGDMSLVGPRPIVREELERYGDHAAYYYQMRPGLTGVWQVSGRNEVDYKTRVNFDVWYVRNWSMWTDIVILLKTARALITRVGAY